MQSRLVTPIYLYLLIFGNADFYFGEEFGIDRKGLNLIFRIFGKFIHNMEKKFKVHAFMQCS
jgi:hypothetical protein